MIFVDPSGKDLWIRGCGEESSTCHSDYVGTWNKDRTSFTPTTIQSDANGNFVGHTVTMGTSGIVVDGKYQGVFASGTRPTVVNGTGNMSGFRGIFNTNCGGHCEAQGTLTSVGGQASFKYLITMLRGPNEKLDKLSGHEGDQYRGGNIDGPDIDVSYVAGRSWQSVHFDWAFPFGGFPGAMQHTMDLSGILFNYLIGRTADPPYEAVSP